MIRLIETVVFFCRSIAIHDALLRRLIPSWIAVEQHDSQLINQLMHSTIW